MGFIGGSTMTETLLYLSSAAIAEIGLGAGALIEAVERVFAAQAAGAARPGPKAVVPVATGHSFHAMPGTMAGEGLAGMKFFGVVPDNPARGRPNVCSLVALSDISTGLPVGLMDGGWITGMRTAAMTAVAAKRLALPESETAAFIGCGVQARAHAALLREVLPGLRRASVLGRSPARRDAFVQELRAAGWEVRLAADADDALRGADIAVSTVPEHDGWTAFLDPALLPGRAFAAAVDLGRSWLPTRYGEFAVIATDDIVQSRGLVAEGRLKAPPAFDADLAVLASGAYTAPPPGRVFFVFSGHVLGDLAVAAALYRRAVERGVGVRLPR
jgi:ornithine cyclodeaminase/alanine dehydrogenase